VPSSQSVERVPQVYDTHIPNANGAIPSLWSLLTPNEGAQLWRGLNLVGRGVLTSLCWMRRGTRTRDEQDP
jgi:hypothetical protein